MDACNTNERLAFQSKATPQFGALFSQSHDINLVLLTIINYKATMGKKSTDIWNNIDDTILVQKFCSGKLDPEKLRRNS